MNLTTKHLKFDVKPLDIEQDKIPRPEVNMELEKLEAEKKKHQNRHFDPSHMDFNLPDVVIQDTSFDPDFMIFDLPNK